MSRQPTPARAAVSVLVAGAVAVGTFFWGMGVGANDTRALSTMDSHTVMAARGVCGAGAELARLDSGYLCVWHRADGGVYARPVMQSPVEGM